jgi:hypothetical protein
MNTWMRTLIVGAALLAGCTGSIGSQGQTGAGNSTGAGTGAGNSTGAGNIIGTGTGNTTGVGGTGVTPTPSTTCRVGVPATTQLPRLTRVQYDNTIKELFTIDMQASAVLAPDTRGSVDQRAWDGFKMAADTVSAAVMANATAKARYITCTPATGDMGAACARTVVQTFGRKAFRRPLTTAEESRFVAMFTNRATLTQGGTFDQAMQLILKSFLMSPSFLTKAEISEATKEGDNFVLSGYEVATRLSYMLWQSMPDEVLLTAAGNGSLGTPAGILTQATRMLQDPKARASVGVFHTQYAHMGEGTRWADITRDPAFTQFSAAVVPTLSAETSRLFEYITFEKGNGTFRDLLTTPVGFVNNQLAPIYGVSGTFTSTLTQTNLDPAQRPGVFTRAGFLTAYSLYDRASPILRGAFLQKEVLCTSIPMPDNAFLSTPLGSGNTNRERVDAQTAPAMCAACHHTLINPTGFAMENYNAIGAWQTTERDNGAAINAAADVPIGATTVHVTGAADLMDKIASSPEAQRCYAQKWVQYAYERVPTDQDACTVNDIAMKMGQPSSTYSIQNLIADLTQSQTFRYRAKELP